MHSWSYRPATDLGLPPRERFRSIVREVGTGEWLAQHAAWLAAGAWLRTALRLKVEGREHLPAQPPFILVANHTSHLDAVVLGSILPTHLRAAAFPIAAGDTFFQTPTAAALSAIFLNALPMWRKQCGPHSLALLRARLVADPCVFIVFPEGTRARDGRLGTFRAGIGRVVAGTTVPVVPCRVEGAFQAWPPHQRLPTRGRVRVRAGAPLCFEGVSDDRAGWDQVAAATQQAVAAL